MTWPRSHPEAIDDEIVADVARMLEAAASEAPSSQRAEEIRAAVLERVGSPHRPMPLFRPLAFIAVLLLAVAMTVGASGVGSWLVDLVNRTPPAPALPEKVLESETKPDQPIDVPLVQPPTDEAEPTPPILTPAERDDAPPIEQPRPASPPPVDDGDGPPTDPGPPASMPTPPTVTPPVTAPPPAVGPPGD